MASRIRASNQRISILLCQPHLSWNDIVVWWTMKQRSKYQISILTWQWPWLRLMVKDKQSGSRWHNLTQSPIVSTALGSDQMFRVRFVIPRSIISTEEWNTSLPTTENQRQIMNSSENHRHFRFLVYKITIHT